MCQDRFSCKACISARAKVKDLKSGEKMADATRRDSHWAIFIDHAVRLENMIDFTKYFLQIQTSAYEVIVFIHCVCFINIF